MSTAAAMMRRFARTGGEVFVAEGEHESSGGHAGEEGGKNGPVPKGAGRVEVVEAHETLRLSIHNFRQISAVQVFWLCQFESRCAEDYSQNAAPVH
eukprot:s3717_g7.t1